MATRKGTIALAGHNPTKVAFKDDILAFILGTNAAPFDLSTDGLTLIADPNGDGDETATFNCAAGKHESGLNPVVDLSAELDTKFQIQVDDDAGGAQVVTLIVAGKNTGELIAAEMQTKIQALGGVYEGVTVAYSGEVPNDLYTITSGTKGTGSKVRITRAVDHNVTEELELGPDGGTDTDGTGDFANAAAASIAEVLAVIVTDMAGFTGSNVAGALKLTANEGEPNSIVMGNGTANDILGFVNLDADYGTQGLGYGTDMADVNYVVVATFNGVAAANLPDDNLSIGNKSTSGFEVQSETEASTYSVDLLIEGEEAA